MIRRSLIVLLGALALAGCGQPDAGAGGDATPGEINFSVLAPEGASSMQIFWAPILADMEKATGLKVKPFYGANYTALVEAMRFGQTDVGWFSNQIGVEAVRRGGGEVFARTFDPSGDDGYKSVLIVPASSKTTLEDVLKCDKTLTFGAGDAKSTSGTLAPMTYLFVPRGVDPQGCFKTMRAGNHQANLMAVAKGVLDVATNNTTSMRLQKDRGAAVADQVRVIWESPKLPEDPIIWRKALDPAVKEKLRAFFLTYGQGEGTEKARERELLSKISIGGFLPADDTHLLIVREMEAVGALQEARNRRDQAAIAEGQKALDGIRAERAAVEAKIGQPVQ